MTLNAYWAYSSPPTSNGTRIYGPSQKDAGQFVVSLKKYLNILLPCSVYIKVRSDQARSVLWLSNLHPTASTEFKSAYAALWVMNDSSHCSLYLTDEASPDFHYYIAVTIADIRTNNIVPPTRTFTLGKPIVPR